MAAWVHGGEGRKGRMEMTVIFPLSCATLPPHDPLPPPATSLPYSNRKRTNERGSRGGGSFLSVRPSVRFSLLRLLVACPRLSPAAAAAERRRRCCGRCRRSPTAGGGRRCCSGGAAAPSARPMETQTWELVGKKGDLNFLPAPTVARGLSRPVSSSRRGRSGAEKR